MFVELQGMKTSKNRLENEVKELEAKNKPFKDSKEYVPPPPPLLFLIHLSVSPSAR